MACPWRCSKNAPSMSVLTPCWLYASAVSWDTPNLANPSCRPGTSQLICLPSFTTSDLFFSSVRCRSELVLQEIGAGSRTSRYDESPLTKFYMDVNAWRWLAKLYQGKNFSTWGWKLQRYTPCSRSVSPNTQSNYSRVLFHCVSTGKEIYLVSLI